MIVEKIKNFILEAKKLMVLKKVDTTEAEPKVSVMYYPNGEVIYTFISSVFPFFSQGTFEEVEETKLDEFFIKCSDYLKNYENNYKIEIVDNKDYTLEKTNGMDIFISKKGEVIRYNILRRDKFIKGKNHSNCKITKEVLSV